MIRIKDIAEKAGVSTTTVSNVIHGNTSKVSKHTIQKVQKLLEEYSYVPSMSARMLAGRGSHMIGILVGGRKNSIEHSTFFDTIIRELEYQLHKRNYYMILHYSDSPNESLKFAATWNVEGLITVGISEEDNWEIQQHCKVPLVSVDVYYREEWGVANVGTDDFKGGYLMGRFLLEQGHSKILFLSDNDIGVDNRRWLGVKSACEENGIPMEKERHIILPEEKECRREFYRMELKKMAEENDALFYSSDYYAAEGVIQLMVHGISVPEDISVAGFDDSEFARFSQPQLTTVHQSIRAKAVAAVRKLFAYVREDVAVPLRDELDVSLVIRESVKIENQ